MADFIKKPPFTGSNCYETIKRLQYCSNLAKNVDWNIAFIYSILNLKSLVTMAAREHLKLTKSTNLRCFSIKQCNFSIDWDKVKGFLELVTRYLKVDLMPFLTSHKSKIFLEMKGSADSFQTPTQKGAHPPLTILDVFI
jgi:hypothetical protein